MNNVEEKKERKKKGQTTNHHHKEFKAIFYWLFNTPNKRGDYPMASNITASI
jgi:hypothetical protein